MSLGLELVERFPIPLIRKVLGPILHERLETVDLRALHRVCDAQANAEEVDLIVERLYWISLAFGGVLGAARTADPA
jgi:hypothetical protein